MPVYAFGPSHERKPTPGESAVNLGNALADIYGQYEQRKASADQKKLIERLATASPIEKAKIYTQIDPKLGLEYEKQFQKQQQQSQLNQLLQQISQRSQGGAGMGPEAIAPEIPGVSPTKQSLSPTQTPSEIAARNQPQARTQEAQDLQIKPEDILATSALNPAVSRALGDISKGQQRERIHQEDLKRRVFESERDYNTKLSSDFGKVASGLRQSIPRKQNALDLARSAIESGNVGYFSGNKLADITGIDAFRDTSGASLALAMKENLVSNLSRVSAKSQNLWLEKVMSGAFPRVGQSQEANLVVQEALEAELALDKAEVDIYNQLAQQDIQKQGYVGGDIEQRTFAALEPIENEIKDRTAYRTRVLFEKEKGQKELFKLTDKKPPRGTPLTRGMFQALLKKTGTPEKAIVRAKQLGYVIYPNAKVEEYTK